MRWIDFVTHINLLMHLLYKGNEQNSKSSDINRLLLGSNKGHRFTGLVLEFIKPVN